jgi:hypothetical protein
MLILRNMMMSSGSGMCVLPHPVPLVAKRVAIVQPRLLVQITQDARGPAIGLAAVFNGSGQDHRRSGAGNPPWHRPWNAGHAASRITRPLSHNGIPYKGINVVMLWSTAVTKGYACQLWCTHPLTTALRGQVVR